MKIAYSLLLLVFSIIITSEMAGIYFLFEFKNTLEEQIMKDSEKSNIMMVNRIDSYATERLIDLINMAKSGTIVTTIQASNMQFSKLTDPEQYIDKMDSEWTSVPKNETTPFMKTLIDSQSSEQLRQILNSEDILFHGKVFGEIFMTNAYGANVVQTDKTSDYKQSDEIWWQEARKNGIYIGEEEYDESSGTVSYPVAYRIDDENGNFIGVAKAVVNIQQIINIIKNQMSTALKTNPVEYELIKPDGRVIYSTDPYERSNSLKFEQEYVGNLNDSSGYFTYAEYDQKYLVTYSHSASSKISPLFDWIFITKYNAADILKPVIQISDYIITIMITLIVTVSIIVFVISKRLARPLEKIQKGLDSFSKGKREIIKPEGTTEVHDLIEQFNHMTETISNSQSTISKSEEKFRSMFELSPVAIILSDDKYIIRTVNKKFLKIFGYNHHDEIVGKPGFSIVPKRTQMQYEAFQSQVIDEIVTEKVWLMRKDGTEIPCIITAQKIYDLDKKLIGNMAIIDDISDIEQANEKIQKNEAEIKKSENLYRGLFELSPDPIRISSIDRITTGVNDAYLKKFGYARNEIVGRSIYENIDDDSRGSIENAYEVLRGGHNAENVEAIYHKKDGTKVPVLLSVSPFRDEAGNTIGYIAIIKDISEIYEARKKIQENEAEILNQFLKIKQIEEQKDQFASMISHELTTPLFPIKFQAEMLKDPKILGKLNKEQSNSVNEIYQNATQLERLISDILDAQKLEMNGMRFIKKDFELKQFMNQIAENGKNLIENKIIEFENTTKDQITLISDSDRLNQVFTNLIKNSIDFVQENTGKIEIGAKIQENDVQFYVKDNGIGIPKDKQLMLFKKFYQIDTSLKRKHRGSGLGLSICKGIMEGLGGKIWLESAEGIGTIVYFTIPKGVENR